jgi:pimeloyl-ACP methyl ester carboxylesterase
MQMNFSDYKLFYEVTGKGPVWVLLHGFLESSTIWKDIISVLSETRTIVSIDLPGHGNSPTLSETASMEDMARAVKNVLQELNIKSATFLGHSMGGYVIMAYTELFPKEVGRIILLNSIPTADSLESRKNRDRGLKVIQKNPKTFIGMAISNLFAENSRELFASEIKNLKEEALQFPLDGITAAIKGMKRRKDRTSILQTFPRDKFMICGMKDPIVPYSLSEEVSILTNTTLIKLKGGHMSFIENKEELHKLLHFIE